MAAALLPAILYFLAVWVGIDAFSLQIPRPQVVLAARRSARRSFVPYCSSSWPSSCRAVQRCLIWSACSLPITRPQYATCRGHRRCLCPAAVSDGRTCASIRDCTLGTDGIRLCLTAPDRQVATIASIILCASPHHRRPRDQTGLGVKITALILSVSPATALWPALLLTALACLFLGMEVPTTAAYVICISVAGPALISSWDWSRLQAHLFVFWFALLSTITPPVCGAVFIAAGMVDEKLAEGGRRCHGPGRRPLPGAARHGRQSGPHRPGRRHRAGAAGLRQGRPRPGAISYGLIAPRHAVLRAGLVTAGLAVIFFALD